MFTYYNYYYYYISSKNDARGIIIILSGFSILRRKRVQYNIAAKVPRSDISKNNYYLLGKTQQFARYPQTIMARVPDND